MRYKVVKVYTSKKCKVCTSPHRREYEDLYWETRNGSEVLRLARSKGEEISLASILNHMKKHFLPYAVAVGDTSLTELKERIASRIVEIEDYWELASILKDLLIRKKAEIERSNRLLPSDLNAVSKAISELVSLMEKITKAQESMRIAEKSLSFESQLDMYLKATGEILDYETLRRVEEKLMSMVRGEGE